MDICRGVTYKRKRRGVIGDPWRVLRETGKGRFGKP